MEVVDGLTTVRVGVHDEAVAVIEVVLTGDLAGGREQIAEQGGVLGQSVGVRTDVTPGDDQHMDGCLGVNIGEGEGIGGLVEPFGGDGAGDDFAEQAVGSELVGLIGHSARLRHMRGAREQSWHLQSASGEDGLLKVPGKDR